MKKVKKRIKDYVIDWYSDQELLDIFPEIKEIIPLKINEVEKEIKKRELEISEKLIKIDKANVDEFSKWFARWSVGIINVPELQKYDRELRNLKKFMNLSNPPTKYVSNFNEKLEIARNRPIFEVVSQYVEMKRIGNKLIGLCPFHQEKTPSFFVYLESNTYHCFGCQAHGDQIKFIMEICGVNFKNAIDILQKQ